MLAALLGALSLFHAAPAAAQSIPGPVNAGYAAQITNFAVTAGDEKLTLSWTAGRSFNRGIWVQYKTSAATSWTWSRSSGESSPYEITNLTNDTAYDVRIFAVSCCNAENANIRSAFITGSGTPEAQQTTAPAAPTNLQVAADNAGLSLTWTAPSGTVTGYDVHYTSAAASSVTNSATASGSNPAAAWVAVTRSGTSSLQEISPLSNNTPYRVRVRAKNAGGSSAWVFGTGTPAAAQSTDATLSALTASSSTSAGGTFTALGIGTFAASTTTYTASVANARTHVKLTPTVSDSNATVAVRKGTTGNFASVTSGSASAAIPLDVGSNAITVRVTAQDSTTKDYTVTVTRQNTVTPVTPSSIVVTLGPASLSVNEGKKAILNLAFSGCKNNNYVGIPVITTRVTSESGWRLSRGPSGKGGISPDVLSYGPDHDFGLGLGNPAQQRHTLTPPTHSCGSGDVYIDTYRDCDTEDETFTVELNADTRWPNGYVRGSQYKVTVTIIDDGGQEFCTRTPSPAREPTDQPPPNTEETDTGDGTPATPANTGGSGGGGGTSGGLSGPPAGGGGGGGGGLPPSGSSDEPPPEDEELSTLCSQEDRETLGNFYETTGGENWDENENWNSPEPLDQWYGVDTDDAGEVVSLRLSHNALSGEVPARELLCLSELKELALWGNDLPGEVPEKLVLAVERAVLRDIAEMLKINPEWFDNYGDPYNFEDWHEGVTTDDDGRVVELDLTGEGVLGEVPESSSELKRLREIMITSSGGGGCALRPEDNSSAFSLFLLALLVFAALGRTRARG